MNMFIQGVFRKALLVSSKRQAASDRALVVTPDSLEPT
jgi:hypothetical protein